MHLQHYSGKIRYKIALSYLKANYFQFKWKYLRHGPKSPIISTKVYGEGDNNCNFALAITNCHNQMTPKNHHKLIYSIANAVDNLVIKSQVNQILLLNFGRFFLLRLWLQVVCCAKGFRAFVSRSIGRTCKHWHIEKEWCTRSH